MRKSFGAPIALISAVAIVGLFSSGAQAIDLNLPNLSMQPAQKASLPMELEVDQQVAPTRTSVPDPTGQHQGTITVDTKTRFLYLSLGDGKAMRYEVGVGRDGFLWTGHAYIGRRAEWPGWAPPSEMLRRRPDLPRHMNGGLDNPLGARAMYLYHNGHDTMFRIHGTNEPDTIGHAVSSGCIRLLNADVIDLFDRIKVGARVNVM